MSNHELSWVEISKFCTTTQREMFLHASVYSNTAVNSAINTAVNTAVKLATEKIISYETRSLKIPVFYVICIFLQAYSLFVYSIISSITFETLWNSFYYDPQNHRFKNAFLFSLTKSRENYPWKSCRFNNKNKHVTTTNCRSNILNLNKAISNIYERYIIKSKKLSNILSGRKKQDIFF